jgi:hypothetical protein
MVPAVHREGGIEFPLIPLQKRRNARDRTGELPCVVARYALHDRLPLRLVLEIDIGQSLPAGVGHDVGLAAFLDLPRWRVTAAGDHARP